MSTLFSRSITILTALLLTFAFVSEAKSAPIPADVRGDVYGDPLPKGAVARIGTVRFRSSNEFLQHVIISPDGKLIVAASYFNGPLQVWSADTGHLLRVIPTTEFEADPSSPSEKNRPPVGVLAIAFNSDSKHVHVMTDRGTIRTCNTTTGKWSGVLARSMEPKPWLMSPMVRVSPDGTHFAHCLRAKPYRIEVLTVGNDKPILVIKDDKLNGETHFATFSVDNKLVAVPMADNTLKIWNVVTGKVEATYSGPGRFIMTAVFAPDGKSIAGVFGSTKIHLDFRDERTLVVWDTVSGKECFRVPKLNGYVLGYTRDGSKLLSLARHDLDSEVTVADAATGKVTARLSLGRGDFWGFAQSPDGKRLVTVGKNRIVIWDLDTGMPVHNLDGPSGWVYHLAFSPDGKTLLVGSNDPAAGLWDAQTGKRKFRLAVEGKETAQAAVFTPKSDFVVLGYSCTSPKIGEKTVAVRLWRVADGKQTREYSTLTYGANKLTLSPDGKQLVIKSPAGFDFTVLDCDTGKQTKEITGAQDPNALHTYPKANELIEAHLVGNQKFIATNVLSNKVVGEWEADGVSRLKAISPDGLFVLTLESADRQGYALRIRHVANGEQVCELSLKDVDTYLFACFSPDSRTIAVAYKGATYVCDPVTGKELRVLRGHTGRVTALAFSPDGTRLATGSTDSTVLIWDLTTKP